MMAPSARTLRFAARTFVAVAGVLFFAAFFISNLKSMAGEWRRDPPGSHPAEHPLALGRQLFENRCAGCHGLDGRVGPALCRGPRGDVRSALSAATIQPMTPRATILEKLSAKGQGMFRWM